MKLVEPSAADIAERCTKAHGPPCVQNRNETVGKVVGYRAKTS